MWLKQLESDTHLCSQLIDRLRLGAADQGVLHAETSDLFRMQEHELVRTKRYRMYESSHVMLCMCVRVAREHEVKGLFFAYDG